jgi:hypothetical protein
MVDYMVRPACVLSNRWGRSGDLKVNGKGTGMTAVDEVPSLVQLTERSRGTRPRVGDVFELCLASGQRLYGVVYDVNSYWGEINRGYKLVGIHVPVADDVPWESLTFERRDLLTATFVTDTTGWRRGYFRTIGQRQLSAAEHEAPSSISKVVKKGVFELRDPRTWELRDDEPPVRPFYNGTNSIGVMVTRVLANEREWGDNRRMWPLPSRPGWYIERQGSDGRASYVSPKQRPAPPDVPEPSGRPR